MGSPGGIPTSSPAHHAERSPLHPLQASIGLAEVHDARGRIRQSLQERKPVDQLFKVVVTDGMKLPVVVDGQLDSLPAVLRQSGHPTLASDSIRFRSPGRPIPPSFLPRKPARGRRDTPDPSRPSTAGAYAG